MYKARSSCAKHHLDMGWPVSSILIGGVLNLLTCKSNYTGPSQSLTYNTVNQCHQIDWQTIGSIWMPDSKYHTEKSANSTANLVSKTLSALLPSNRATARMTLATSGLRPSSLQAWQISVSGTSQEWPTMRLTGSTMPDQFNAAGPTFKMQSK